MKNWGKPVTTTLTAEQLAAQIEAAARSGQCFFSDYR